MKPTSRSYGTSKCILFEHRCSWKLLFCPPSTLFENPSMLCAIDCNLFRMIIPSRWVRQWLLFAHIKAGNAPGPINMWPLLKEDRTEAGGWRPLKTLLPPSTEFGNERPGHYRWDFYKIILWEAKPPILLFGSGRLLVQLSEVYNVLCLLLLYLSEAACRCTIVL